MIIPRLTPRRRRRKAAPGDPQDGPPSRAPHRGWAAGAWEVYASSDGRQLTRGHILSLLAVGTVLAAGALLGIVVAVGEPAVARAWGHARWGWLVLAPIAVAVSHLGYSVAYREVADAEGKPDMAPDHALALVAAGFGVFNTRGGFALDELGLAEFGFGRREAKLRVLVLATLEYAVLAPAAFAAALAMLVGGLRTQAGLVPSWVIGVPAGAAVAVALMAIRRLSGGGFPGTRYGGRLLGRFLDAVGLTMATLFRWPGGLRAAAGMSLYWAADIAALGAALAVFGHGVSVAALVLGYATGYALTRRSLPLAGSGAVEALLPFALSWVSVSLASAVLAVVAYRLFNLWLAELGAAMGLRRLKEEARRGPAQARRRRPAAGSRRPGGAP